MACADVATVKAKAATAINLIISFLPCFGFLFWLQQLMMPCFGTQIKPRGPHNSRDAAGQVVVRRQCADLMC
jgi:hypothetical protein